MKKSVKEGLLHMPKMRLIADAYKQIKQDDPNSALTMNGLKCLIKKGEIPSVKIGRKTLINYDTLIEYLSA